MKKYESALILGLGDSGEAAARLLLGEGARVTVAERRRNADLKRRASALRGEGVDVRLGVCKLRLDAPAFDVCVASPGVPLDSEWLRETAAAGVEVISELELGASRCACRLLAVTGSNGKSTLVKLCCEALRKAGLRADMGGNCGPALCDVAPASVFRDWLVVEASSFQLETVREFRPDVGVLLNMQPNHLDRHASMEAYIDLKCRLFAAMDAGNTAIVPAECEDAVRQRCPGLAARVVTFGSESGADFRFRDGTVFWQSGRTAREVSVRGTWFDNRVLGLSAAAAVAAMEACGVDPVCVAEAAHPFKPLPHRMQEVARLRDVRFVDDSKATTLAAMAAALEMAGGPCRLIAGGLLKESDLDAPKEMLAARARSVYLIGRAAPALKKAWEETVPCVRCRTLARAVAAAWRDAQPGETVLLAPGCASFDQFSGYRERGEHFGMLVAALDEEG